MFKWLIERRLAAFERRFQYDLSYARHILDADTRAFLAIAKLTSLSRYRRDVPLDVYHAVKLTGTLAEDCGPCTQLIVGMALQDGVAPEVLAALVAGDESGLNEPVRLGVAYARAVLEHAADADTFREQLLRQYGPRAIVSLAFALTSARLYPTLKYALGHGQVCQRVVVAGRPIQVLKAVA